MPQIFYEKDADLHLIRRRRVAVFGHGSEGYCAWAHLVMMLVPDTARPAATA